MDYILCTNDCWKKLHQDFWVGNFCKVCSNNKMCKNWARNDLDNYPNTKDRIVLAVGTSCKREKPLEKIDILIIGNKPAEGYVPPESQFPYTDICGHIDNFYQDYQRDPQLNRFLIRYLWCVLDCHNISWVYIDFLKNPYVDSNNMLKTKCIEFLLLQILALQPTIILTLGNKDGLKDFFNIFAYPKKLNGGVTSLHGEHTKIKIDIPFRFNNQYFQFPEDKRNDYKNTYSCILDFPYECNWIISMFPGGMNFKFTSISGWEPIFQSIGNILSKPINPENCPEC